MQIFVKTLRCRIWRYNSVKIQDKEGIPPDQHLEESS